MNKKLYNQSELLIMNIDCVVMCGGYGSRLKPFMLIQAFLNK